MKKSNIEITAGRKTLEEVKIQRGIFQGDLLLLLHFDIAMMPFSYILRKYNGAIHLKNQKSFIAYGITSYLQNNPKNQRV